MCLRRVRLMMVLALGLGLLDWVGKLGLRCFRFWVELVFGLGRSKSVV